MHAPGAIRPKDLVAHWEVEVPVGSLVVFDGDVHHRGLPYTVVHVGVHTYQDSSVGAPRERRISEPNSFKYSPKGWFQY